MTGSQGDRLPPARDLGRKFGELFWSGAPAADRVSSPGHQILVQLLRGGYLGADYVEGRGRPALDVGCGAGNNLVGLARMGWRAHGCDLDDRILAKARDTAAQFGCEADLRVGSNTELPYADDAFDLAISMNALHYLPDKRALARAIAEYARVLRRGAPLVALLVHPHNWVLRGAKRLRGDIRRVTLPGQLWTDERLIVLPDRAAVLGAFAPRFERVEVGISKVPLPGRLLAHYLVVGYAR